MFSTPALTGNSELVSVPSCSNLFPGLLRLTGVDHDTCFVLEKYGRDPTTLVGSLPCVHLVTWIRKGTDLSAGFRLDESRVGRFDLTL